MIKFGSIKKEHLVGAAIGVGTVAAGYYLYKKNQNKVDSFLRKQGINIKKFIFLSIKCITLIKILF